MGYPSPVVPWLKGLCDRSACLRLAGVLRFTQDDTSKELQDRERNKREQRQEQLPHICQTQADMGHPRLLSFPGSYSSTFCMYCATSTGQSISLMMAWRRASALSGSPCTM